MGSHKPESLKAPPKPYGKIALSLSNCLLPEEKLNPTPSMLDGLDPEVETDLRIIGCELIQTAGILLKLPQVAMATGQVLFQRFYYSKSFVRHPMETTAMGCVCLASKIEEAPRRIRDVINVFHHIRQVMNQKSITPMLLTTQYMTLKTQVIKAERRVLKELGFCVHVKHPHKIIVTYLQVLGCEKNQKLMQLAWNYMNDSLRTDVFVRYDPETIASACIYLTARKLRIPLPRNPAWYSLFHVLESDIQDVCKRILRLYTRPKANTDELERQIEVIKKEYQLSKDRKVLVSGDNTPTSNASPNIKSPSRHNNHKRKSRSRSRTRSPVTSKSRSRSRSPQPPKHKKSKKYSSRARSRSKSPRSRSRTPDRKYKKSHKSHKDSKDYYTPPSPDRSPYSSHSRSHSRKSSKQPRRSKDKDKDGDDYDYRRSYSYWHRFYKHSIV
ncbi:cyclin-L1 isoform X2 [Diaphorina citri]|uniref:Cyclin-L1 isoform X1 n=1 Tax=Diaphorina citri TaxID=121845 RepID=A0A1S4EFY2_DIACI|nr:cyclin-L1 isoform X1 [Diaphorina citri]XP_026681870.1 cyclin-L1 isoform X1 [Diaphorina citri]XP_026681876.1 cyclin-L1 isoform X1 [Diaphorina citri]XP_026681882.1 cyclin-L1 isoform X2 [Diaphorina citri]KAI5712691.1 hypothetical protein M8J75_010477 [Diaphorina citri]